MSYGTKAAKELLLCPPQFEGVRSLDLKRNEFEAVSKELNLLGEMDGK